MAKNVGSETWIGRAGWETSALHTHELLCKPGQGLPSVSIIPRK